MSDSSMDFFSKVLLIRALLHSKVRQFTKQESAQRSSRQFIYPYSFCSSFLKGSAFRQLKAIVLKSFSDCFTSSRNSTIRAALSYEQKHSTQTTRWMTCEKENWGAADTTVAQTLQTGSKTPSCLQRKVSMPTNSRNSQLQDPQREAKASRVKTLCWEESVPKVEGLVVMRFSHRLPLSRVSPKRRSSFLMESAILAEAWWQFLQTRCSLSWRAVLLKTSLRKLPQSEQTGLRQRLHWCQRTPRENFFWQSWQCFSVPRGASAYVLRQDACMSRSQ